MPKKFLVYGSCKRLISYSILDVFLGWRWNIKVDKSLRSLKDRSMSVSAVNTKAPGSAFAV